MAEDLVLVVVACRRSDQLCPCQGSRVCSGPKYRHEIESSAACKDFAIVVRLIEQPDDLERGIWLGSGASNS